MTYEDLENMNDRELEKLADRYGVVEPTDESEFEWDLDELAEKITEEKLRDPMAYLEEIYGDDTAKKAIEIAGIDVDSAAEEAVDTDGPEHFLARYDGNSHTTPGGLTYWRVN